MRLPFLSTDMAYKSNSREHMYLISIKILFAFSWQTNINGYYHFKIIVGNQIKLWTKGIGIKQVKS